MIAAIALAAALAASSTTQPDPSDFYYDDAGCVWVRRPPSPLKPKVTHAKPAASAASAPSKPKPKKRSFVKPEGPSDEFIGCDTLDTPKPPLTAVPAPEPEPEAPFTPVPDLPPMATGFPPDWGTPFLPPPPETFETGCCNGPPIYFPPVYGGPVYLPPPSVVPTVPTVHITHPVPEPASYALFGLGLAALVIRGRYRR